MKYFIFVTFLLFLVVLFIFIKKELKNNEIEKVKTINKKSSLINCNLYNEIINRKNIDSERQCYYDCGLNDIVRVDTSISYPCQNYILENR